MILMTFAYFKKNVRKITPKAAQEEVDSNPTDASSTEKTIIENGL
jgi:hypothetical protein